MKNHPKIFVGKSVLVTGGTGMIGIQLVKLLVDLGARIRVVSMDRNSSILPKEIEFMRLNLTSFSNCRKACRGMDFVFHLAGIKVSAGITSLRPASIFVPGILMNTNIMEAARIEKVKRFLYTSTVGIYGPAKKFVEDEAWQQNPSPNDWFGGWAKRMGELQLEAYRIEFGWNQIAIVRPANVYGPYDNFDHGSAMVIPSLIRRVVDGENPLKVWGDGSEIRDFIHAKDVARGMIFALANADGRPVNLGSGIGVTIKKLVWIICRSVSNPPTIKWDISKKSGDRIRLMDIKRAKSLGWKPEVKLSEGIKETMNWFIKNRKQINKKYNVFYENKFV